MNPSPVLFSLCSADGCGSSLDGWKNYPVQEELLGVCTSIKVWSKLGGDWDDMETTQSSLELWSSWTRPLTPQLSVPSILNVLDSFICLLTKQTFIKSH